MFNIKNQYLNLIIISILFIITIKVLLKIIILIYKKSHKENKELFNFNQRINLFSNLLIFIFLLILWWPYLKNIITIISFISAGITIAIRDVIANLFAGLYIKMKRPFKVEDRIEINDVKGDVVVINSLSFKVLEIGNRINGEQSSGRIVSIPNSHIFSYTLKNYNTAFKYLWNEMIINIPLNANIEKNKKEILKIINENEVVSKIPKKMDKAVMDASLEYRIYYNHLDPIIYTSIKDNHIELTARFLVHPKKVRNIEDEIWCKIIKKYQDKKIDLFNE